MGLVKILIGIISLLIVVLVGCAIFFVFNTLVCTKRKQSKLSQTNPELYKMLKNDLEYTIKWVDDNKSDDFYIKSVDGIMLHAVFLDKKSNKTILLMHGYKSSCCKNFSDLIIYYYEHGFNVLLCDQRTQHESEGKFRTFGILEGRDVCKWCEKLNEVTNDDSRIILHGVSMGSTSVLMSLAYDIPTNVIGVIADCGFTSAWEIFKHIFKTTYHLATFPILNIANIISKMIFKFDFKSMSTLDIVANTSIPILFIHGKKDDFVPIWMSDQNYKACKSKKEYLIYENAGHALAYHQNKQDYKNNIMRFIEGNND